MRIYLGFLDSRERTHSTERRTACFPLLLLFASRVLAKRFVLLRFDVSRFDGTTT